MNPLAYSHESFIRTFTEIATSEKSNTLFNEDRLNNFQSKQTEKTQPIINHLGRDLLHKKFITNRFRTISCEAQIEFN